MNDLHIASDGVALIGHEYSKQTQGCWFEGCGVIKGHMIKINDSGVKQWEKSYGNYPHGVNQFADSGEGNWALIYNECWGIQPYYDSTGSQTGYALACGTGIEGCSVMLNNMPHLYFECLNDPRKVWRALTVVTDMDGERVWSRMDSWQSEDKPVGSASEFVLTQTDGKVTFLTDEAIGFGFAKIAAADGTKCADTVAAIKLQASALFALGALYLSL